MNTAIEHRPALDLAIPPRHVMVVDDSLVSLLATRAALEAAGWEVTPVEAPLHLAARLVQRRPDVLLLNVEMPVLGGGRLLGITSAHRLLDGVIVVFQSSRPEVELRELAACFGADGWVRSAGDPAALANELDALVRRVRAEGGPRKPQEIWSAHLALGCDWQDRDHEAICRQLGRLGEAIRDGRARSEIIATIRALETYTECHFRAEEEWAERIGYPEREQHRRDHDAFRHRAAVLLQRMEVDGASVSLALEIQATLHAWVFHHIRHADAELARFAARA